MEYDRKQNPEHVPFLLGDESELPYSSPVPRRSGRQRFKPWHWTAGNLLLLLSFTLSNLAIHRHYGTCIWRTDFDDATQAIEYEEKIFTGALVYNTTQQRAVRLRDGTTEYFGPPSRELDAAWEELLRDEFPTMTEKEATPFLPQLQRLPELNEYHFELTVFHSLHCLNAIRLELSPVLYNVSTSRHTHLLTDPNDPHWQATHMEHCLDQLRQSVQCFGDLTPSPLYPAINGPFAIGRSGVHTCRKFAPIRAWLDERAANGKSLAA
ncbi:hypothetical protein CERZMDRAFT_30753 [Cercospora zeae-maydis SCOH1-5]|uniref:Cyclochlorotine biosynthesis protein O n=1 Tax=Cercospora zeae-maydis SCOH1-5 TaxID=717836 RepID=A0A6A6FW06_9PEZI|nr:hypothetical protein CERZMDRAFT_30753 [Cercospora zeae-maydis SCOH1-5]